MAVSTIVARPVIAADAPLDPAMPQRHARPGVFCLDFPPGAREPFEAVSISGGAVHVARAMDATDAAYVVASTLPDGRSVDQELTLQRSRARPVQTQAPALVQANERKSALGSVLMMRMRDVAASSPGGEFPLDLAFHDTAGGAPVSFAASRLFVRGPDRIEAAILARPDGTTGQRIDARRNEVDRLADAMLDALQRCTATLPPRRAN